MTNSEEGSDEKLSHWTKAVVFLVTVAATELGSHAGLYLAMAVWLELDLVMRVEKGILDYIGRYKKT